MLCDNSNMVRVLLLRTRMANHHRSDGPVTLTRLCHRYKGVRGCYPYLAPIFIFFLKRIQSYDFSFKSQIRFLAPENKFFNALVFKSARGSNSMELLRFIADSLASSFPSYLVQGSDRLIP